MDSSRSNVKLSQAVIIGCTAGVLGGMFGVGGGFIIVPGLVSFAKMERRLAHGTSMAATVPIALGSVTTYLAHGNVDWPVALFLTIGSMVGAVVGTHLLRIVSHRALVIVFVITVVSAAARLLIGGETTGRADMTVWMAFSIVAIGFVAGLLAGMLGIGGGVIRVPAMVVLYDMTAVVAKGTSSVTIIPSAIVGTYRNRKNGNVDLRVAAVIGVFGAGAAVIGGTIATQMSNQVSNAMFAILLLLVAASQLLSLRHKEPGPAPADTAPTTTV